ncbi:hypothetical protein AAHA92_02223 [Salvia divinorum]|uniref:Uncharacterized protein n=1 Tax=Salvia divinorum TaxID=28513 RepID=A0ABD1IDT5_SALDI
MQKFKFLATQCAVAGSPSRSPTTSPGIHLRRRTTLRMLLTRGGSGAAGRRRLPPRCDPDEERSPEKASVTVGHKLKDLFVSSPPSFSERASENVGVRLLLPAGGRRGGARSLSATFRQRLLRRAWRPALVAIPE